MLLLILRLLLLEAHDIMSPIDLTPLELAPSDLAPLEIAPTDLAPEVRLRGLVEFINFMFLSTPMVNCRELFLLV